MAKKQSIKKESTLILPTVKGNATVRKSGKQGKNVSLYLKLALLLGIISFVVYANTLKNGFVFDDRDVITENTFVVKGVSAIPEIMFTPYRRGYKVIPNDLYRPLSLVMFAAEYQFFGKNPLPYHFFNILLYVGCVILLFFFLDRLFEEKKIVVAFIASLLFALHPVHTEVVANIKSLDELFCFFFAFLSLNFFIGYVASEKISQLLIGSCCFFLALLSKETVITFLAIIPLIFFFYRNENKKCSINITVSVVLVAIIFLVIRFSVLNSYHANEMSNIGISNNALAKPDLTLESRTATAILILGYYIKILFVPYPLLCDYSYNSIPFTHFSDPWVLISLVVYLFLAVFSIGRFTKNTKDIYAFSVLFFLITMTLFSNIFFLIGTTMGERLLFFPSVGFCVFLSLIIEQWGSTSSKTAQELFRNPKVIGVIVPLSIIYCVVLVSRNSEWISDYTLFTTDIKNAPNNWRLNSSVGTELDNLAKGESDPNRQKEIREEAITYFQKSLAIYPENSTVESNLGNSYFSSYKYDLAELHEKRALELDQTNTYALNTLASIYFIKGMYANAIQLYSKAIKLKPDYVIAYPNIAACYYSLGKYDSTIYYLNRAIQVDPSYDKTYRNLVVIYNTLGKMDSVRKYEAIARSLTEAPVSQ